MFSGHEKSQRHDDERRLGKRRLRCSFQSSGNQSGTLPSKPITPELRDLLDGENSIPLTQYALDAFYIVSPACQSSAVMAQHLGSEQGSVVARLADASSLSPTPVCPRVTLTIEISEVLFSAIQITATMSQTTVPAFIGSALRQTQIAFFAEISESPPESDVVVLDVRAARPQPPSTRVPGEPHLGALQSAILGQLVGSAHGASTIWPRFARRCCTPITGPRFRERCAGWSSVTSSSR